MKLLSDIINKDFNKKVEEAEIDEEYLEEILPKLVLSINDTSDKSENKDVEDIDKKLNLLSDMIEGNSNLKGRGRLWWK